MIKLNKNEHITIEETSRLLKRTRRDVNRLSQQGIITRNNEKTLISVESLKKYKEEKIKKMISLKQVSQETSFTESDLSLLIKIGLLKSHKIFFFNDEIFITKSMFHDIKNKPSSYIIYSSLDVAVSLEIEEKLLINAHKKGTFKGYTNEKVIDRIYYDKNLIKELKTGEIYIPGYTSFSILYYVKEYNISLFFIQKLIKEKKIRYIKINSHTYILKKEVLKHLKYLKKKSYNHKKNVQLINENFKKIMKERYLLKIKNEIYLIYKLDGNKTINISKRINGDLFLKLSRNPIDRNIDYDLVRLSNDKVLIKDMYDKYNFKYLNYRMNIKNLNNLIIELTSPEEIKQFEIILSNQLTIISPKYNLIIGTQYQLNYIKTFSPEDNTIKNKEVFILTMKNITPILIIYRKIKKRKIKKISMYYNYQSKKIKFIIDEFSYIIDYKNTIKHLKKHKENITYFIEKTNSYLEKISLSKEVLLNKETIEFKEINSSKVKNKINIKGTKLKPPIYFIYDINSYSYSFVYGSISEYELRIGYKIIPYQVFEAIIKRTQYNTYDIEFSRNHKGSINLLINSRRATSIKINKIILTFSFHSSQTLFNDKMVNVPFYAKKNYKKIIKKLFYGQLEDK